MTIIILISSSKCLKFVKLFILDVETSSYVINMVSPKNYGLEILY